MRLQKPPAGRQGRTIPGRTGQIVLSCLVVLLALWAAPRPSMAQSVKGMLYIGSGPNLASNFLYRYNPFNENTIFWNILYRGPAPNERLVLFKPQWIRYYINVWDKELNPDFVHPLGMNRDYLEGLKTHQVAGIPAWSPSVRGTGISPRERRTQQYLQRLRERMIGEGALRHAWFGAKENTPWYRARRGLSPPQRQRAMRTTYNPLLMNAQTNLGYVDPFANTVLGRPSQE